MIPTFITVVVASVIPLFFIWVFTLSTRTRLMILRDRCRDAYLQVDSLLTRRHDLIEELMEAVNRLSPPRRPPEPH